MATHRIQLAENYAGTPQDLPHSDLPTYGDIARCFYKVRDEEPANFREQVKRVKDRLENSWQNCSPALPLLKGPHIFVKLMRFCEKVKSTSYGKKSASLRDQLELLKDKLFDISACTCQLPVVLCAHPRIKCCNAACREQHVICECDPDKRVPVEERPYLRDQQSKIGTFGGAMQMGLVDQRHQSTGPGLHLR